MNFSQNYNKYIIIDELSLYNITLFSVTSINITFYLKTYFHLSFDINLKNDRNKLCSRLAFKSFFMKFGLKNTFLHLYVLNILFSI